MKLVSFTSPNSNTVWVNPECVVFVRPSVTQWGELPGTAIVGEGSSFIVNEDMAAVVKKLQEMDAA